TLAVEVHQSSATSGDLVWGLELNASRSVTNSVVFGVVLNEVMANNVTFAEAGGTNLADWVELYNPSTNAFDLSGLSLSDDLEQPGRWVFPAGVTLPPGGYLVVRCDPDAPASSELEPIFNTGFGLKSDAGDAVYLFDADGRGGAMLDSVVFGLQVPDYSIGRIPNGRGAWALNLPSPGAANIAAALGNSSSLVINEWLANPSGNDKDFVELYNPLPQPIDLSQLFLSDNFTNRTRSALHPLSFIGVCENGFVRLIADSDVNAGADHLNFGLSAAGEAIVVYSANQDLITSVTFGRQENGVSEGRFPDGSTNIVRFRGTTTPGRSNLLPLESIAVSEVLTHTDLPLEDAIELENISSSAVD
ncbi:MAG TPA: lamin tail domain-containing protein, partial [Candidatus Dormibacteraeota bacterium]|nr:lamin tail domain-containing protein [Candidatus Dormibacteraeota bacterium]